MRIAWLVLVVACGPKASSPTSQRVEASGVPEMAVDVPVRDLHARGVDSAAVGEYEVGACWMSFDAGQYANHLVPASLEWPDQYRSRVAPIDGRTARWVTYRATGDHAGYAAGVYLPRLQITIVCPTAADRDRAIGWLATMHVTWPKSDETIVGPAEWQAEPACVTAMAPAGTSTLRVEGNGLYGFRTDLMPTTFDDKRAIESAIKPGTYTVYLQPLPYGTAELRCQNVVIAENQVTIVRAPGAMPTERLVAREIYVSPETYRRTYTLTRTGDRVELEILTEKGTPKHLDGSELKEAAWTPFEQKREVGMARDGDGGFAVTAGQIAWRCKQQQIDVHPAQARPVHVGPVSNAKVGCLGAKSEWRPPQVLPATAVVCGPIDAGGLHDLAFQSENTIDTVVEWIDCHIQTHAYRLR